MMRITLIACVLLAIAGLAQAQSNQTALSVDIKAEAALIVNTATTALQTSATDFSAPFIGTTSFTYLIRTSKSGGTGTISLKVTGDFGGSLSLATLPAGDALTYGCTVSSPATSCSGSQTATLGSQTAVASFINGANSAKAGNGGTVQWSLTDDPIYDTGSYTATVTFYISAT